MKIKKYAAKNSRHFFQLNEIFKKSKGLFRRINESEVQLKTGKLYDEQAFGNCSKLTDFEVKSNDPGFDQYEDIVYDPEAFTGSPYNEILEAAGIKKPNYDTPIYESRRK